MGAAAAAAKSPQLSTSNSLSLLCQAHAGHFTAGVGFAALAELSAAPEVAELEEASKLLRHYVQLRCTVLGAGMRCRYCPSAPWGGQQPALPSKPRFHRTLLQRDRGSRESKNRQATNMYSHAYAVSLSTAVSYSLGRNFKSIVAV